MLQRTSLSCRKELSLARRWGFTAHVPVVALAGGPRIPVPVGELAGIRTQHAVLSSCNRSEKEAMEARFDTPTYWYLVPIVRKSECLGKRARPLCQPNSLWQPTYVHDNRQFIPIAIYTCTQVHHMRVWSEIAEHIAKSQFWKGKLPVAPPSPELKKKDFTRLKRARAVFSLTGWPQAFWAVRWCGLSTAPATSEGTNLGELGEVALCLRANLTDERPVESFRTTTGSRMKREVGGG